ncbi:MAG: hypothetical protein H6Q19_225 [Bacteroidetes bacterium]|nr:hypothetical protein [Bacteroidota bacterium]
MQMLIAYFKSDFNKLDILFVIYLITWIFSKKNKISFQYINH